MNESVDALKKYQSLLEISAYDTFEVVGWGSAASQKRRFDVLVQVGDITKASVIDVGCGLGHLIGYLQTLNFQGTYLGLEILPEMIKRAQNRYPDWSFLNVDIMNFYEEKWADYVFASGIFTYSNVEWMQQAIEAMYQLCKQAVAFNSLSHWASFKEPDELYADPLKVVEYCRTLTPWVVLRHDYMAHDFTIYMYREQQ